MISVCAAPKGMDFESFGLKTGIDFTHFGLELGIVFEGPTVVYEHVWQLVPIE